MDIYKQILKRTVDRHVMSIQTLKLDFKYSFQKKKYNAVVG